MFQPFLRSGLNIPFEITRSCPSCKNSAATKAAFPHGSVVVNFTRDFYLACINHFCPDRLTSHFRVNCFLKHRDYSLASMNLLVDGTLSVTPETVIVEGQQIERVTPDFKIIDPVVTTGPYKRCAGHLTWADSVVAHDTWLKCTECAARYHAIIFVSRGMEPAGSDCTTLHHKYRFEVDDQGNPTRLVRTWIEGARNIRGVSRDVALYIDKCLFEGQEITEAEKAH